MFIFPISLFGPIEYYKVVSKVNRIQFEIYETYKKQSIRNRYKIGSSNGALDLSVPISKPNGSKTITKDIIIDESQNWKINHWRAIKSAYMHAPYFEHYESDIFNLIFSKETILYKKNIACFEFISKTFELNVNIETTQDYLNIDDQNDFRNHDFSLVTKNNKKYIQPFSTKFDFIPNLSILDLLFCEGPMGRFFLIES